MKTVYFNTFNFAGSFLGSMLSELEVGTEEGEEAYYITCLRSFERCGFNLFGLQYACSMCEYRYEHASTLVTGKHTMLKLDQLISGEDMLAATDFLKGINKVDSTLMYEHFDVGDSVLSSYISKTRDKELTLSEHLESKKKLVLYSIAVYRAVKRFFEEKKIEKVVLFNGRWDYYRAAFRAAQALGIQCIIVENLRAGGVMEYYPNCFPHNQQQKAVFFNEAWDSSSLSLSEKEKIAEEFFSKKKNGEAVIDRSYSKDQKRNKIPEGVDLSKKLVVVYNSSDDEFAAIGEEYKNFLFEDQSEGIAYLADLFGKELKNEYHLVIRMHPNLKGLKFAYAKKLHGLIGKYPNVHVEPPESDVDSYALMDAADKVITFGSTMGVEATYWGKPSILLSKTVWFCCDIAHVPSSKEQIKEMITGQLELKPKVNAEKMAFYLLKGGFKSKYYEGFFRKTNYFKGVNIDQIPKSLRTVYKISKLLGLKNRDSYTVLLRK